MQELPGVRNIEGFVIINLLTFGQPVQFLFCIQLRADEFPELQWYEHRHVAPETIDITFIDPKGHRVQHRMPEISVIVIEVYHILPAMQVAELSMQVTKIIFGVFTGPAVIPTGMVRDPVNDYFK